MFGCGNSKIMVMLSTKKFGYKNTKTTHLGIIYIKKNH